MLRLILAASALLFAQERRSTLGVLGSPEQLAGPRWQNTQTLTWRVAQEQPQMVWEGQVDGVTLLRIHGGRVDADEEVGLPVQRQRFRFFERLPERLVGQVLDRRFPIDAGEEQAR